MGYLCTSKSNAAPHVGLQGLVAGQPRNEDVCDETEVERRARGRVRARRGVVCMVVRDFGFDFERCLPEVAVLFI